VFGTQQADELKSHQHKSAWSNDSTAHTRGSSLYAGSVTANGGTAAGFRDVEEGTSPGSTNGDEAVMFTTSTGGSETRPRNRAMLACIKF
jgi:hypothetical protein